METRIAISMTSCLYAHFDHVNDKNNYEQNSVNERGFGSSTGEKKALVAHCEECWYQGEHQDAIASNYSDQKCQIR